LKKLTQLGLLLGLALGITSYSQASVLIEPVIGYNLATKLELPAENYSGGSGAAIGGRLGYQYLGLQLGLDYLRSSIDMDDNDFDDNVKLHEWAAFAGFEFPVLFRVYAGYIFSAEGETENAIGQTVKFEDGTGMKLGVGFTGLPFIDINFEFRKGTFDKIKGGGLTSSDDTDYSTYMIALSAPFNF
jgi:hypothetical protein